MIKSPFTSVSIPGDTLHETLLYLFESNAEKKALVCKILSMAYTFYMLWSYFMLYSMS